MEECMFSSWEDQFGNIDVRRSTGMSKSKLKKAFLSDLKKSKDRSGSPIFTLEMMRQIAKETGLLPQIDDFYSFVEELNVAGYLTKTGRNSFELRSETL
jgi:hypothetical protein